MRLSVKNEHPLYNAYRGRYSRSLSLSPFVPSIRNLISHESERRLSSLPPSPRHPPSIFFFSRFSLFFFRAKSKPLLPGNVSSSVPFLHEPSLSSFFLRRLNVADNGATSYSDELLLRRPTSNQRAISVFCVKLSFCSYRWLFYKSLSIEPRQIRITKLMTRMECHHGWNKEYIVAIAARN